MNINQIAKLTNQERTVVFIRPNENNYEVLANIRLMVPDDIKESDVADVLRRVASLTGAENPFFDVTDKTPDHSKTKKVISCLVMQEIAEEKIAYCSGEADSEAL